MNYLKNIKLKLILNFQFILFALLNSACAQSISYLPNVVAMDSCSFELGDSTSFNYQSILIPGSLQESLVQLYLYQEYSNFQLEYSSNKEYLFLGVSHDELQNVQEHINFTIISKFYYQISGVHYCLLRLKIKETNGGEMIYHSRLVFENQIWKSSVLAFKDPLFINKFSLWLKPQILYEILVLNQSQDPFINAMIIQAKDPISGKLILDKIVNLVQENQDDFKPYYFDNSQLFNLGWERQYID